MTEAHKGIKKLHSTSWRKQGKRLLRRSNWNGATLHSVVSLVIIDSRQQTFERGRRRFRVFVKKVSWSLGFLSSKVKEGVFVGLNISHDISHERWKLRHLTGRSRKRILGSTSRMWLKASLAITRVQITGISWKDAGIQHESQSSFSTCASWQFPRKFRRRGRRTVGKVSPGHKYDGRKYKIRGTLVC